MSSEPEPGAAAFDRPWLRHYGAVPESLDYPEVSLYEAVMASVRRVPDAIAYDFLGRTATYRELGAAIDRCAAGLAARGLRQGERVSIIMPTSPQAVIFFYAALKLGAVASMIHPLSTAPEIASYLAMSRSRFALTLDAFAAKVAEIRDRTPLETLIVARIPDYLPLPKKLGFWATRSWKIGPVPKGAWVVRWSELMAGGGAAAAAAVATDDPAAILYSGGTTGRPKAVLLSHRNFISEGMQAIAWVGCDERDRLLAVLPIFHGFGLSVLVNAPLMSGAAVVMVPAPSAKTVAAQIRAARPTVIAGVPSLYNTLALDASLKGRDLSFLRAAFSGGDTLPRPTKERFERLVEEGGGRATLLEGYGLTEAVTGIMATPLAGYREGSIGIPFPDMLAKVCRPGTEEAMDVGEDGEICVSGPAVMLGYLDDPEATAATVRVHADGRRWLHTGDIGRMDEDGYFTFTARLKQLIKTSGMSVYPSQVEEVLYRHPAVQEACVIGVPDEALGERVKAVVVAKAGIPADDALAGELIAHCQGNLIKWACPREVVFRDNLPKTPIGKVDARRVKERELAGP